MISHVECVTVYGGTVSEFFGLSTDTKPTATSGSYFYESDTGSTYIFDQNAWKVVEKRVDGKIRVSSMPYTYDIAEGNVSNHTSWSKIGYHGAVSSTELDLMPWAAGVYAFPSGALTMTIVSSSVEDDPVKADTSAGTGAWTVTVYYLTTGFVEKSVTVTMNGTVAVTIAADMYRVQNARIATAGTSNAAVGNLTIASGGVTYGYISATKTRMRQLVWTVPINKTLYVTNIAFSGAGQEASKYVRFTTRANYDEKSNTVLQRGLFMPFNEIVLNNTSYNRELSLPTRLPATTDLKVSVISDATAVVTGTLRGWVES